MTFARFLPPYRSLNISLLEGEAFAEIKNRCRHGMFFSAFILLCYDERYPYIQFLKNVIDYS